MTHCLYRAFLLPSPHFISPHLTLFPTTSPHLPTPCLHKTHSNSQHLTTHSVLTPLYPSLHHPTLHPPSATSLHPAPPLPVSSLHLLTPPPHTSVRFPTTHYIFTRVLHSLLSHGAALDLGVVLGSGSLPPPKSLILVTLSTERWAPGPAAGTFIHLARDGNVDELRSHLKECHHCIVVIVHGCDVQSCLPHCTCSEGTRKAP